MTKEEVINLLEHPEHVGFNQAQALVKLTNEYPFFQSLRCVHLKLLHYQKSFLYNSELKEVAVQTPSREILFDFITNKKFNQLAIAKQIDWNFSFEEENFGLSDEIVEKISNPDKLFEPKEEQEENTKGKPLTFSRKDNYSFNMWLQLTKMNKIKSSFTDESTLEGPENQQKQDKIDAFLRINPKISKPSATTENKEIKLRTQPTTEFMTETLARVYEEQKKYKEAIQAYTILILNNPEKSSFFADQIKRIEQILENNK